MYSAMLYKQGGYIFVKSMIHMQNCIIHMQNRIIVNDSYAELYIS